MVHESRTTIAGFLSQQRASVGRGVVSVVPVLEARGRYARAVAVALLVSGSFLALPPAVAFADESLCVVAIDLAETGYPEQALEVIKSAQAATPPQFCSTAVDTAYRQINRAAKSIAKAQAALKPSSDPAAESESADQRTERIRKTVEDNVEDAQSANAAIVIPEELQTVLNPPDEQSNAQNRESRWSDTYKQDFEPVGKMLGAGLAIVLAIVTIARLLVLLPPPPFVARWRPSRKKRGALLFFAIVGVVPGLLAPLLVSGGWGAWTVAIAVISVLDAMMWAYVLATRTRITVEASGPDGKSDDSLVAAVAASLRELGAEPPRGLEVPIGTDVDVLQGKSISAVGSGLINTVLIVMQTILGVTPWRVHVNTRDDATTVLITRNSRIVDSMVVPKTLLKLGEDIDPIGVDKMVAAF